MWTWLDRMVRSDAERAFDRRVEAVLRPPPALPPLALRPLRADVLTNTGIALTRKEPPVSEPSSVDPIRTDPDDRAFSLTPTFDTTADTLPPGFMFASAYDPEQQPLPDAEPARERLNFEDIERPAVPFAAERVVCQGCGRPMPSVSDLLRESVSLLDGVGDEVVRMFYRDLIDRAPYLADMFPLDLLDEDAAHGQRDKLLRALVALATTYDPDDAAAMMSLDTALAAYGRAHSAFPQSSGGFRAATLDEYALVKVVLFSTLHEATGDAWQSEFDAAWSRAYDYAAARMMNAAIDNPQQHARTPRASA